MDNLTCDEFWTLHRNKKKDKYLWIRFCQYINNGWGCQPLSFHPSAKITHIATKGNSIAINSPPDESEVQDEVRDETFDDDEYYIPGTDYNIIQINNINDDSDYDSDYEEQDPQQENKKRLSDKFEYNFYSECVEHKLSHVSIHKNLCYSLSYYRYIDYMYIEDVDRECQGCISEYNDFPINISCVISMKKSKKGGKEWLILGRLNGNNGGYGKYFFFKASSRDEGFEVGGVIVLYICNDYNLLINTTINDSEKYCLGLILSETKKKLANMVYYKFVELLSKSPHGYYFLKDIQQQLLDSNSPHHEQFKVWVSNRNYNSIDKFLSS